ncbi:MAG TPA: bile acid:sodium symporter family protein [Bacteroidales bacterium]|nr:bile acid:sodium symporter family protein [Bacteroidales bacterium]HRT88476.1 bile acid:sodium symporter family protein [Bacteroidales bacterium]
MKNSGAVKMYLAFAGLLAIAEILLLATRNGNLPVSGLVLFAMFYALAFSAQKSEKFKGLSFTLQIFAFVSFTLYFPEMFTNWGFNTNKLIVPSIQVIMFGMGTKLNIGDFIKELSKPLVVIAGTVMVFILMPLAAILIIKVWNFPPEVAAGIILVGACPGGVASNVMTYLAKGNLALSVTVTTFATLLSPVVTPLLMMAFAGQLIEVNATNMMLSIVNMILIPIFAGIIANKILYGKMEWVKKDANMIILGIATFIAGLIIIFIPFPAVVKSLQTGLILVSWAVTIVSVTIIVIRRTQGPENWMDLVLPKLSLGAIMLYIVIVAAHNKATLLTIGPALFIATIMHNLIGFGLGYGTSRLLRLSDEDVRALTIEVGLKNSGLAVGLAYDVLKSQAAALAPLIFGTWMNIAASSLASFWSQREPKPKEQKIRK